MGKLRAASAFIDVTPKTPVPLCASGALERDEPFTGINDPLEWNALLFDDGEQIIILVSGDFLSIGQDMRLFIEEKLAPVPPQNIICAASHTHLAPALDPLTPVMGETDPDYLAYCRDRLDELLNALLSAPRQPVSIGVSTVLSDVAINRRKKAIGIRNRKTFPHPSINSYMLPNEQGYNARQLYTVSITSETDDKTLAVLWSFACHPTCAPHQSKVSADYPGHMRGRLRNEIGAKTPVLFLQGFCGDIRPKLYDQRSRATSKVKRALYGNVFGPVTKQQWRGWLRELEKDVSAGYAQARKNQSCPTARIGATRNFLPISALQDVPVDRPDIALQHVRLTDDLAFFALSAEPVNEISAWIEEFARGRHVIPIGYTDRIFGYLPTSETVRQGGYEAHDFRHNYSLPGKFRSDIDDVVRPLLERTLTSD